MTHPDYDQMRRAMVDSQLRPNTISEPRLLTVLSEVPRERFVPEAARVAAYIDRPVPLGGGRWLNAPLATARLISEARPTATDRVLVIGSATGYAAAVLAPLVASVTALEEDAALTPVATDGVTFVSGPLAAGWAAGGPYDLIVIDGAVEAVPAAVSEQLVDGGRLATGLVERGVTRLAIGRRAGNGFGLVTVADAEAVILPGFAAPPTFTF
ncbi:protein-L-isoaspartate O-methyltransferase family protein [Sphingomonas montana]|uniref:protein-L-isoaspartate O-methyltransferase family protein n=1 Tax=Sphingomonas montana TaxID=1843236 RepID=UPI00096E7F83|nr:protein-L-isoaspartate O-methyltransferase [Sphingomonas montana]